jgi:ferritin-like metal-binding protein YciE
MTESPNRDTIKTYVGDMYSLESHIEEAMDRQLNQFQDHSKANAAIRRFHTMVRMQRDTMKAHLDALGGGTGGSLKSAVSNAFGVAAGVVDKVRPEAMSKILRDDYTSFNLAAMSYHMLYGTALMLGFNETAQLAERHHRAYTDAIQDINQIVLSVVALELKKDGHVIDERAMDRATDTMNQDWKATAPAPGVTGLGTSSTGGLNT